MFDMISAFLWVTRGLSYFVTTVVITYDKIDQLEEVEEDGTI